MYAWKVMTFLACINAACATLWALQEDWISCALQSFFAAVTLWAANDEWKSSL